MDSKTELVNRLNKALKAYLISIGSDAPGIEATAEIPRNAEHGDFASNIAMQLTKILKRNPMQVAEEFLKHFNGEGLVSSASIAKPGFINFRLDPSATVGILRRIASEAQAFGKTNAGSGTKVLVEFVSANPTGPLHIGHARNAVVGDVLGRLLAAAGYSVTREYYFNDAGVQMNMLGNTLRLRVAELLGRSVQWPEQYYRGDYMIDIAKRMIAEVGGDELAQRLDAIDAELKGNPSAYATEAGTAGAGEEAADAAAEEGAVAVPGYNPYQYFTDFATREILKTIDHDLKAMGIAFDNWFLERSLYENGDVEKALLELRARGVIYEKDGAVWFRSTDYGVERDRVVIKRDGNYTYLMPDIAYNQNKYARGYDRLITLLGADHHGQISSLVAAAQVLGHPREALDYVIYQMVTLLKDGEMIKLSTRSGQFITFKEMIDELGPAVVRYFFAMRDPNAQMVFDWGLAKTTSMDNPVYYVQYAHARCCSLFRKAEEMGCPFQGMENADLTLLGHPDEQAMMRALERLPQVIEAAARDLAPQYLTGYLQEVATLFHTFFTKGNSDASLRFIIPENLPLTQARLALIRCVQIVLSNALQVLGIEPMDRM